MFSAAVAPHQAREGEDGRTRDCHRRAGGAGGSEAQGGQSNARFLRDDAEPTHAATHGRRVAARGTLGAVSTARVGTASRLRRSRSRRAALARRCCGYPSSPRSRSQSSSAPRGLLANGRRKCRHMRPARGRASAMTSPSPATDGGAPQQRSSLSPAARERRSTLASRLRWPMRCDGRRGERSTPVWSQCPRPRRTSSAQSSPASRR